MLRTATKWIFRLALGVAALVGIAAIVLAVMIARPLVAPPALASIAASARAIDMSDLPPMQRFQARDGTELGYRQYAPADTPRQGVILIHGSSGNGAIMNMMGRALARAGILAITPDLRGHGVSGTRGDISYIGQLEDDLEDLVRILRRNAGDVPLALAGHSSGGGFALRVASGDRQGLFQRYVLLAPFLGPFAATSRPSVGEARWAQADVPRLLALSVLRRAGITCCEHLPVLAFATAPGAELRQTTRYSYRLMQNFGVPDLFASNPLAQTRKSFVVITGDKDELIDGARFGELIATSGQPSSAITLAGLDHMRLLGDERTAAEIVKALAP